METTDGEEYKSRMIEGIASGLQSGMRVRVAGNIDDTLTVATLCDLVLGEDAEDRSNAALVRAVKAIMGRGRGWE